jgi:hypothetical protein
MESILLNSYIAWAVPVLFISVSAGLTELAVWIRKIYTVYQGAK